MSNKNLPQTWLELEVRDIASSIQYGYTESSSKDSIGPKFLRITDIQDNKVDWSCVPYCTIVESEVERYLLQDGDLVFARTGATVGKSFLIKGDIPRAVFASYLIRVRFNHSFDSRLAWYYFQSPVYWTQIIDKSVGTGQPNVNGTKLGEIKLPLPPLAEQQRIVAKIEELFASLDKGIEALRAAQQQLKVYRQAVLKYAFEGRLTNPDVKEGELPEGDALSLPKGWVEKRIQEIGKIETGTTPSKARPEFYSNGTYPFYKPTDLEAATNVNLAREYVSELGKDDARYVPEGTTLVTCIGATIGKTGLLTLGGIFNQQINAIIPNKESLPKFVYYQAISPLFQEQIISNASATTLPILNKGKFSELTMVVCNLKDQEHIVQEIESRLSVCDKIEETITQSLQQAEALRQSILKKAFEGKLVPQNPKDEPASVLLERIASARLSAGKAERALREPQDPRTKKSKA